MKPKNKCEICNKPMFLKDSLLSKFFICSDECKQKRKQKLPKHITHKCVEYWVAKGFSEEEAKEKILLNSKLQTIRRKEYWIKNGFSEKNAEKKVSDLQRKCSPRCVEYWVAKGFSEEEAIRKIKNIQQENSQKSIAKYTSDERRKRSKFSPMYWINKGMTESNAIAHCKQNSDNMSKEVLIKKFGEIGLQKYYDLCNYRKENYTLNGYIKKYGEIEGLKRWTNRFIYRPNSKTASKFFNKLMDSVPEKFKVYCGNLYDKRNHGEYGIRDGNNYYFCDFVIPELKICIEFYGDYWHCNPLKYDKNYYHPQKKKTAEIIWDEDKNRIESIKRLRNFQVYIVWESNQNDMLNKIKEVIQKEIANNV